MPTPAALTLWILDAFAGSTSHIALDDSADGASAPGTATASTGATVGTTVTSRFANQVAGSQILATAFTATTGPPAAPLTGNCLVTRNKFSCTFAATNWTIAHSLIGNGTAPSGTIRCRFRVFASTDQTFQTNVREITTSTVVGSTTSGTLSTTVAQNLTATWACPGFSLNAEYFALEVSYEIVTASGSTSAAFRWRQDATNSKITTSICTTNYVQYMTEADVGFSGTTANTAALNGQQRAGDLIAVGIIWIRGATTTVTGVTDTSGNTYVQAGSTETVVGGAFGTPGNVAIFYAKNVAAASPGTNTVTVTFSDANAVGDVSAAVVRGCDTTSPLVTTVGNQALVGGTTATTGTYTASVPAGVAFAVFYNDQQGAVGAASPFVNIFLPSDRASSFNYRIVPGAVTEHASASQNSGAFAALAAVFKAPAGTPTGFMRWSEDALLPPARPVAAKDASHTFDAIAASAPSLTATQWATSLQATSRPAPQGTDAPFVGQAVTTTAASGWKPWATDLSAMQSRLPPTQQDAPFVGSTLGFAPVRFVPWTTDTFRPRGASSVIDLAHPLDDLALAQMTFAGWNVDLGRPSAYPVAASPIPFVGTLLGLAPTPFVPWTSDVLRPRAPSMPVTDAAHPLDALTLSQLTFSGWNVDLGRPSAPPSASHQVPFVGSALGFAPVRFQQWINDGPPVFRQPPGALDTPYTGNTLGWAPVRFVTWTNDTTRSGAISAPLHAAFAPGPVGLSPLSWLPLAAERPPTMRASVAIDGAQVLDVVTPVTIRNFAAWSFDLPRGPKGPPPVETVAPTSATSPPAIGTFRSWPADVTPQRSNAAAQDIPYVGAATTPVFVSGWRSWAVDTIAGARPAASSPDAFVTAPLGVPPRVSFVGWSVDLPATRTNTVSADGAFNGSSLPIPFVSSWRAWATDAAAPSRKTASLDGVSPIDATVAPLFGFASWANDAPISRTFSAPIEGASALFALATPSRGFAGWTTHLATPASRPALLDGASAIGTLIRGSAPYFGWTTDLSSGQRIAPVAADSFVFDVHVNASLFDFVNWTNDNKPLPKPTFPLSAFESWSSKSFAGSAPRRHPKITPVIISVGASRRHIVILPQD